MSRYSEKLERRREEAAREAEKAAKAERHAAARPAVPPAAAKPAAETFLDRYRALGDRPLTVYAEAAKAHAALDAAHAACAAMVAEAKGCAKGEAVSLAGSLWAAREKAAAIRDRALALHRLSNDEGGRA